MLEVIKEPISVLLVIKPTIFEGGRGFFMETLQKEKYREIGVDVNFVQDNWSRSTKNVLRGLHYQKEYAQGKLVSVRFGRVFDVAVDLRKRSSTYGQWFGEELSDKNKLQMYVPEGFAHGFCVLSEIADFSYKCTEYYKPHDEAGIRWNDPELNIDWKIDNPIVSLNDQNLPLFENV